MRLGLFAVEIPQGHETNTGYVALEHNTKYSIKLSNLGNVRCDADVDVDGKRVLRLYDLEK